MKVLYIIIVIAAFSSSLFSQFGKQNVYINYIDNKEFPNVKVYYTAINEFGNKERFEDLSEEDFILTEDGVDVSIKNGNQNLLQRCDDLSEDIPVSVVLALDMSQSLIDNPEGKNYFNWINSAATRLIDSVKFENGSEVSILPWVSRVNTQGDFFDWLQTRESATATLNELQVEASGATDFNAPLYNPGANVWLATQIAKPENRKIVIFFTDGEHLKQDSPVEIDAIIQRSYENAAPVYVVETNSTASSNDLDIIANGSGGKKYRASTEAELENIFFDLYEEISFKGTERCFLEYEAGIGCGVEAVERELELSFLKYAEDAIVSNTRSYLAPAGSGKTIEFNKQKVILSESDSDGSIRISAINGDVNIIGFTIEPDLGNISFGVTELTVAAGTSENVSVILDPLIETTQNSYTITPIEEQCEMPSFTVFAPCAILSDGELVDFGDVNISQAVQQNISITNNFDEVSIVDYRFTGDEEFFSLDSDESLTFSPFETKELSINFQATNLRIYSSRLDFLPTEGACDFLRVNLRARVVESGLIINPTDFGELRVGISSAPQTVTIENPNDIPITIDNIALDDEDNFEIVTDLSGSFPLSIPEQGTYQFDIVFTPQTEGNINTNLTVEISGEDNFTTSISGIGTLPQISADPLNYGNVAINSGIVSGQIVIENNSATEDLVIDSYRLIDLDGDFTFEDENLNITVEKNSDYALNVNFNPNLAGARSARLELVHNAEIADLTFDEINYVNISANVTQEAGPLTVDDIDFGTLNGCTGDPNDFSRAISMTCPQNASELFEYSIEPAGAFLVDINGNQTNAGTALCSDLSNANIDFVGDQNQTYNAELIITDTENNLTVRAALNATLEITTVNNVVENINNNGVYELESRTQRPNIDFSITFGENTQINDEFELYLDYNASQLRLENYNFTSDGTLTETGNDLNSRVEEDERAVFTFTDFSGTRIDLNVEFSSYLYREDVSTLLLSNNLDANCFSSNIATQDITVTSCVNEYVSVSINGDYTSGGISPNPVNTDANYDFSIAIDAKTTIEIFNSFGSKVDVLLDMELKAGEYNIKLPISDYKSGVYIMRITSNHWTETERFIIQK